TTDNITWTGYVTPKDNVTGANDTLNSQRNSYNNIKFTVGTNYNDLKGNSGKETKNSNLFVVDTKPPVVEHVQLHDERITTSNNNLVPLDILEDTFDINDVPRCVPINSNIKVVFDYIMDPNFVTANTNIHNTDCDESIQVSSDNFVSCIAMTGNPAASQHDNIRSKKFTLEPAENLDNFTTYKVRVTSSAVERFSAGSRVNFLLLMLSCLEAAGSSGPVIATQVAKLSEETCTVAPQPVLSSAVTKSGSIIKSKTTLMLLLIGTHLGTSFMSNVSSKMSRGTKLLLLVVMRSSCNCTCSTTGGFVSTTKRLLFLVSFPELPFKSL
ncbi:uncharacterized protein METZ01_LOCUS314119, partial [marine metagenome]